LLLVASQPDLFHTPPTSDDVSADRLLGILADFSWYGRRTAVSSYQCAESGSRLPVFVNEFWTSDQRAAHSLHEISYRACFKPQLPAFFIDVLSRPGDTVFDPFAGRGTTLLEAALRDRVPAGCDVNPLSRALIMPRLSPPALPDVHDRLRALSLESDRQLPEDLLTFYHPKTLAAICEVRDYLLAREAADRIDRVDEWIRMVTLNRLTGHSPGFLSVYTLPPNQAVSVKAQQKINVARAQTPPERDYRATIVRKSRALLADVDTGTEERLQHARSRSRYRIGDCTDEYWPNQSIRLVVTSPPFLDVVDYASDNWLRCWFCGIAARDVKISLHATLPEWKHFIERVFHRFSELLQPKGFVVFEVGEVRHGRIRLEETVVPCGVAAGLTPVALIVNDQTFTKTANIWGVRNNAKGTNTNRIIVFQRA
jgi:hypothetical protein